MSLTIIPTQTDFVCTHREDPSKEFPKGRSLKAGYFKIICTGCNAVFEDDPRVILETARYESLLNMEADQNEIVEYLRLQYKNEIERGDHSGMSFPAVIMKYLARERRAYRGWFWSIFG